ncbi:MAG: hypothetical protein GWO24_17170 [Akkermansiaceae bacterium]|nr:hypothetical protein [Akkermansiaceae bacterium]
MKSRCQLAAIWTLGSGFLVLQAHAQGNEPGTDQGKEERPAFVSDLPPLPEIEPVTRAEIDAAIRRGVDFLISSQNRNGSWGAATMTKGLNITADIPGAHHAFRAGTTGLALEGLLASGDRRPETLSAIDRAEAYFLKELPRLRRATTSQLYNTWGHSYGLKALSALYEHREGDQARRSALRNLAQQQVQMLTRYEDVNGGWGYYDFDEVTRKPTGIPTSFTTATVMLAMKKARKVMEVELPEREVKRGMAFLRRQQTPDFAYVYSDSHRFRPRYGINRPGGSLCRSQACNAARRFWDDQSVTDEVLKVWLDRLILRNGWVDIARKRPIPHETHFSNSGYFYYYGHYYAMDCIALLPETERSVYYQHYAKIMLSKQEKNGCWWDYPLYSYHQAYGTGYALRVLSECRQGAR